MNRVLVKQIVLKSLKVILIFVPLYLLLGALIPQFFKPAHMERPETTAWLSHAPDEDQNRIVSDGVRAVGDPVEALNLRIALMREAQHTLDVTYYSVSNNSAGEVLMSEMIDAADRGVKVRFMNDGKLGKLRTKTKRAIAAHPNIEVAEYNPVNILKPWDFNEVMHDKFMVVDGRYAILGGRNLEAAYFNVVEDCPTPKLDWDILMVKPDANAAPDSSIVDKIADYNDMLWQNPKAKRLKGNDDYRETWTTMHENAAAFSAKYPEYYTRDLTWFTQDLIRPDRIRLIHNPLCSGRKEPWVFQDVAELAAAAEENVFIQTPYSTGSRFILDFMSESADRVPTTVLTNSLASALNLPASSNYVFQRGRFVKTGASIYEFQGEQSLHGKAYQFDHRITLIGSYNLDSRSTYMTTETMVVVDSEAFAEHFNEQRDRLINRSLLVGEDNNYVASDTVAEKDVPTKKTVMYMIFFILLKPFQYLL